MNRPQAEQTEPADGTIGMQHGNFLANKPIDLRRLITNQETACHETRSTDHQSRKVFLQ
jgi:hypothetical protein